MQGYQGAISIRNTYRRLLVVLGVLTVAVLVSAFYVPFNETVKLRGTVVDGTVSVAATKSGNVTKVYASASSYVEENQKLIRINVGSSPFFEDQKFSGHYEILQDRIGKKKERLSLLEEMDKNNRRATDEHIISLAREASFERERMQTLSRILSLKEGLLSELENVDGLHISRLELNNMYADALRLSLTVRESEDKLHELQSRKEMLLVDRELARTASIIERLKVEEEISLLEQELLEAQSTKSVDLTAVVSGTVSEIYVEVGDFVSVGDQLAVMSPSTNHMSLQLQASSGQVGKISQGQLVSVRYDAFPFSEFGTYYGRVDGVDHNLVYQDRPSSRSSSFRIKVLLDKAHVNRPHGGENTPLIPGSTVTASILVKKQTLVEWLVHAVLELPNS